MAPLAYGSAVERLVTFYNEMMGEGDGARCVAIESQARTETQKREGMQIARAICMHSRSIGPEKRWHLRASPQPLPNYFLLPFRLEVREQANDDDQGNRDAEDPQND